MLCSSWTSMPDVICVSMSATFLIVDSRVLKSMLKLAYYLMSKDWPMLHKVWVVSLESDHTAWLIVLTDIEMPGWKSVLMICSGVLQEWRNTVPFQSICQSCVTQMSKLMKFHVCHMSQVQLTKNSGECQKQWTFTLCLHFPCPSSSLTSLAISSAPQKSNDLASLAIATILLDWPPVPPTSMPGTIFKLVATWRIDTVLPLIVVFKSLVWSGFLAPKQCNQTRTSPRKFPRPGNQQLDWKKLVLNGPYISCNQSFERPVLSSVACENIAWIYRYETY